MWKYFFKKLQISLTYVYIKKYLFLFENYFSG